MFVAKNQLSQLRLLCGAMLLACAAAATAPCQWSTPSTGTWSSGPWLPSGCQNNIISNITTASGGPFEIFVDVPATISGAYLGRDVSLVLVQDLNLTKGELRFERNGTLLFAPTITTPVRCSRVLDAARIALPLLGSWQIACGEIIGPVDMFTQVSIGNFENRFQMLANASLDLTRVNFTGFDSRRLNLATMGPHSAISATDSLLEIRDVTLVGLSSNVALLRSSLILNDAGLTLGSILALSASDLFLYPGSGVELSTFYAGAGSLIAATSGTGIRVGNEFYLEESVAAVNILLLEAGSKMGIVRSNASLSDIVVGGAVLAEDSRVSLSRRIILRRNSSVVLENASIVLDNSANVTMEDFSLLAVGDHSRGAFNGGQLTMRAASLLVRNSSSLVLAGGSISVSGCSGMNLELTEDTLITRPCTIVLFQNASLQTTAGDISLGEKGAIAMSGARLLAGANILAAGDTFVALFNKSLIASTGSFGLLRGSTTAILEGSLIRVDGGIFRGIGPNVIIDHSEFRVTGGSMELLGEASVQSTSSNIFIGNTSLLDGLNRECTFPSCHIVLSTGSSLLSSSDLEIVNNFKISATGSSVYVPGGNLFMANGALIGLENSTLIVSGPNTSLFDDSYIRATQNSLVQIDGSLLASGRSSGRSSADAGLLIESGSQLSVGGTILLRSGAGIAVFASTMVANLGSISTDASSLIYLADGSTLYGTGRLDANVVFVNSTIGDVSGVTDLFIKNLTLTEASNTTAQVFGMSSTLRINSTTAVLAGSLTVTLQPGAAVDSLKSGQELVLISSSDSLTGAFDSVTLSPPAGESASCYNVQQTTVSLAIVFIASNPGCSQTSSPSTPAVSGAAVADVDSKTAAIIGGSVAGGVVGVAIIFVAVAAAVPSLRRKIFPFQARVAQRTTGDTLDN